MKRFPRGSEWRKWDLHVHPPGTKLNNKYVAKDGEVDWDRFCDTLHHSDVYAIGITDYFSLDNFFEFKSAYSHRYPNSEKVFFPNLELRLNESINKSGESVDCHIIFPPNLRKEEAHRFLGALKTEATGINSLNKTCAELRDKVEFEGATVSRANINEAIRAVYGPKANTTDHLLIIVPINGNGIRTNNTQRNKNLSDEIDKDADGFFGNAKNVDQYLRTDRLESSEPIAPKPVFSGCDAHSFDELESWLGKEVGGKNSKYVTWVKADLTFEGLQQTLVEPSERVRIRASVPDKKEPYRIISRITFTDSDDFPSEVVFNPGLNAIIGSRSSGKSALLAYIAHAADPDYTVDQQVSSGIDRSLAGPGASYTWESVKDLNYTIHWESETATTGKVIYIPQNSLYAISARPNEITEKIQNVLFQKDSRFAAAFQKATASVIDCKSVISKNVSAWFELSEVSRILKDEIRDIGDRKAIAARAAELKNEIAALREESSLVADDIAQYELIMKEINSNERRLSEISKDRIQLDPYVVRVSEKDIYESSKQVSVTIKVKPTPASLPSIVGDNLRLIQAGHEEAMTDEVEALLVKFQTELDVEFLSLSSANKKMYADNKDLIAKSTAHSHIEELVSVLGNQVKSLSAIDEKLEKIDTNKSELLKLELLIRDSIKERDQILSQLTNEFNKENHSLEQMTFSIETEYDPVAIKQVSESFNKKEKSPFLTEEANINIPKILAEPEKFILHMSSGKQKLKQGKRASQVVDEVLGMTRQIRFVATLDDDKIGGFTKSSMTPGKQSLFALALILAESNDLWPLLIDQPEDDLDNRSVYDVVTRDLINRKRERQIIMVSHNANLVIGADSEEVIVANRHGVDRMNKDGRMFEYLTGSLEYSKFENPKENIILESAGIREHACRILDGGEEAFQKRKDKYRI